MHAMANPEGKHRPKRRHHGDGSVVKRTDRWRARPWAAVIPYRDAQGRRREMWLSAGSRAEAEKLRHDEVERIRKGIVPTDQTVEGFVNAWLGTLEVGPGTWPTYKAHVTQRIGPTLGAIALDRLQPQQVRSAMLAWTGAPATRAGTLRLLRAAMRQAVADRAIEHDPTAGIPYPRAVRKRPVTLTGQQARALMELVKGERFAPILVVSLGLGIRRGEALGLRTQDINWEDDDDVAVGSRDSGTDRSDSLQGARAVLPGNALASGLAVGLRPGERHPGADVVRSVRGRMLPGTPGFMGRRPVSVTIQHSLRYIAPELRDPGEDAYRLTATKTHDETTLPLPAFVAEALRERLAELDAEQRATKVYAYNDYVFCDLAGGPIPVMRLSRWFAGVLERAGLPHMRWHDLRASCATVLIEEGVDLETTRRILRHRDVATTLRYVGDTPATLRDAASRIDKAMGR